jgi:hypothetical protein
MGNRMQLADRTIVDSALMARLNVEIDSLASMYPGGFSVRLHVLGDFASIDYARSGSMRFARSNRCTAMALPLTISNPKLAR